MTTETNRPLGTVERDLPSLLTDQAEEGFRLSQRGEQYVVPLGKPRVALADEGSYFVATNPTPGTGISSDADAADVTHTEAFLLLYNSNTAASGKRVYFDYLKLLVVTPGTNGTTTRYFDTIDSINRYSSLGTAITPKNPNMDSSNTSGVTLYAGDTVATAQSAQMRLVGHGALRTGVIAVAGDTYMFDFAGDRTVPVSTLASAGTAVCHTVVRHAPVVLGPGQSWCFSIYGASQSVAGAYEFELAWWER